jgi:hypothetical protein
MKHIIYNNLLEIFKMWYKKCSDANIGEKLTYNFMN